MCGIVGIAARDQNVDIEILSRMRDTMVHRGPDDQGIWCSSDHRVGFGHRRLAIIDLSPGGHQPMLSHDSTICITFNGEIYNYIDLRDELRSRGHAFHTESDTEVILAAYAQWGTDLLSRLNGMFAFAIYDATKRVLFIARDRAGEKPLFYSRRGNAFTFASELKALMAMPGFEKRIDRTALNQYFTFGYVPAPQTMLRGVHKLPAAHALTFEIDTAQVKVWPYWTLGPAPSDGHALNQDQCNEFVAELSSLMRDAVRRQMMADVPVGILLSGGLDSSLITAMAASVSSRPVRTFTISFPGHGVYDEAAHAKLVANHFGTEHHELVAEPTTIDLLPRLAAQYDEPMADSSMLPTYLVSRLIRRDATVALGGDGGDELFGGYMHHAWLQRQDAYRRVVPRPLRRAVAATARRVLPLGFRGRNWITSFSSDVPESIATMNTFFDPQSRSRLLRPVWQQIRGNGASPESWKQSLIANAGSPLQQATRADFLTYLPDDILVKVDRASMLTSLEVRAPLLDYRMIEFAFGRLPDSLRATAHGRKIILRMLARKFLPAQFDSSRKQGFSIPLSQWFKGEWGRYMESVLAGASPDIFDRHMIRRLVAGQKRGFSNSHRLFSIVMFELWRRTYDVSL
jgi:asparagine synthase (glutamine-hydrolysing)